MMAYIQVLSMIAGRSSGRVQCVRGGGPTVFVLDGVELLLHSSMRSRGLLLLLA